MKAETLVAIYAAIIGTSAFLLNLKNLEPSKRWTGAIRPRPDVVPDLHTGNFYTGIYASNRDRPYLVRIPKRRNKLPAGTTAL